MNTIKKSLDWLNTISWINILLIGMFLTGGYLIWERYQAQLYSYLPYIFLLLCPLMHIFMCKGHGKQKKHDEYTKEHEE